MGTNATFKFCGENISLPKEYETLSIDIFNDDMVEVTRKFDDEHPDVRIRKTAIRDKFIVRNFGYKNVKEAIEFFNTKLKQ